MNYPVMPNSFLQAVLEGFVDGIVVLTEQQEVLYANQAADCIYAQLGSEANQQPKEIQQVYDALIECSSVYPGRPVIMESETNTATTTIRIRAQWLKLEMVDRPCVLIRLQDQNQATQGLAIAEAQRWELTPRETEVWTLRRCGRKRKDIAAELYIAEDTVKKHLRNIQFKRQAVLDEEEWRMQAS